MTSVVRKTIISEIDSGFNAVMSEPSPDHYDDIVRNVNDRTGGWVLDDYIGKNNIALFNHDKNFPIGKFERVRWENGALRGCLKMAPKGTSPRIDELRKLIQAGILRGISVGFRPIESVKRKVGSGTHFLKQSLVECSLVATPANPNALLEAKALGISNATIREVFVEGNKNASLADRIFAARCAVKYTERQKREIVAKAKAMNAKSQAERRRNQPKPPAPPPISEPRLTVAQQIRKRAEDCLVRGAREKQAELEARKDPKPTEPNPEVYTYYIWGGQKIPIARRGLGGAGEENKYWEANNDLARKGRFPWDDEEE